MQITSPAFEENAHRVRVDAGLQKPLSPRLPQGRAVAFVPAPVQHASAAVAGAGIPVPPSAPEWPTMLNPLAGVGTDEDAWASPHTRCRGGVTGGFVPRGVMPVTGPSRSADVERTLEPGAYGPRRPHVVLVGDEPAALTLEGCA